MIPGPAWNWLTVSPVQQSNVNEKMKQKTLIYMVIKPSIVRVGCSAFLVLAAAVLTAASLLAPFARAAAAKIKGCDSPSPRTVPVKIVNIKNNSDDPIYVVLETAKQDLLDENERQHDRWLQPSSNPRRERTRRPISTEHT